MLEARYGRLLARLDTVHYRLTEYLKGRVDSRAELEVTLLRLENPDGSPLDESRHARAATPSWIK